MGKFPVLGLMQAFLINGKYPKCVDFSYSNISVVFFYRGQQAQEQITMTSQATAEIEMDKSRDQQEF